MEAQSAQDWDDLTVVLSFGCNLESSGMICVCVLSHILLFQPHGLQPNRLLCPWNLPGKNTGAGCHFLLQGIFPMQGSNLHLPSLLYHR